MKSSWEGQPYYNLSLISTETTAKDKRKQSNRNVTDHDESELLTSLIDPSGFWSRFALRNYIEAALSEARGHIAPSSDAESALPNVPLPDLLELLKTQAPNIAIPDNLTLKLKVSVWTKQDTFADKEYNIWPLDVRHHRGKRRIREKHLEKWNLKHIGRGGKQLQSRSQGIKEEATDTSPVTATPATLDTTSLTQTRSGKSATESHRADAVADRTAQRIDKYYKQNLARVNSQPLSEVAIERNYRRNLVRLKERALDPSDACADAQAEVWCDVYADACADAMVDEMMDEMMDEEWKTMDKEEEKEEVADETYDAEGWGTKYTAREWGGDTSWWEESVPEANADFEAEPEPSSEVIIRRDPDNGDADRQLDTMSDVAEAIISLEWEVLSDISDAGDASKAQDL